MPKDSSVLRTHRRTWALKQKELALLLGISSTHHLSRVERALCSPGLKLALASEIVFGVHPKQLFPTIFNDVEEAVVRNLFNLGERLKENQSPLAARKRQLVDEALKRATLDAEQTNDA